MANKTTPQPLIPFTTKTLNIDNEFFTYKSIHETVFYGSVEGRGFYFGDDAFMAFIKNENVKKTVHFEFEGGLKQYKVKYENGAFFNGSEKMVGKTTRISARVNRLVEQYLDVDGIPMQKKSIEGIENCLVGEGMYMCREYKDTLSKYIDDKTTFEFTNTLADGFDNNVLKLQNDSVMIVAVLGGFVGNNNNFFYSPVISLALDILPGRIFRAGFDYKGRFVLFTNNTAVILREIKNKELAGVCTELLDKDMSFCCLLIGKKKNAVKGVCDKLIYPINTQMDSLLDKKNTTTPIVKELRYGKSKWQKLDIGKTIRRSGVNFTPVAQTDELIGYENKDGLLLVKSK